MTSTFAPDFGQIDFLLVQTSANSISSVCLFSIQNLLFNDLHNCLENEKVNILQYIYMNKYILV